MKKNLLISLLLISFNFYAQKNLPDLKLKNLNGKTVLLSEFTKNKTVVLSFWATWCGPCINELDAIAEQYDELQDEGFELIAISIDDSRTKSRVKPLVNGKDWEYTILLDSNQELKRSLNIVNVPYVIIVKNNKIVYTHSCYNPGSEEEIIKKFN
ncbi:MAG TPA: TlpA family protein disulfide reductase, partial [Flavobacteriia bacterium]|nr:TlpA family protein disulfide reductase [Flavobacteriia bacterium]